MVSRYDVFHVAGEEVAVVGKTIRKRRAVIEDELAVVRPLIDRSLKGVVLGPPRQNSVFNRWKIRLVDGWIGLIRR